MFHLEVAMYDCQLNIRISVELKRALELESAGRGVSQAALVKLALTRELGLRGADLAVHQGGQS